MDIPAGQGDGGLKGLIGDGQLMVCFVPVPQALENIQGGLRIRL